MKKYLLATGVATAVLVTSACSSDESSGNEEASSEESGSSEESNDSSNEESNDDEPTQEELEQQEQELEEREQALEEEEASQEEAEAEEEGADAEEAPADESSDGTSTENLRENIGETYTNELGETTLTKVGEEDVETSSGPIDMTLSEVSTWDTTLSTDYQQILEMPADITYVQVRVTAENTSEEDISFYPDQSTISTSEGDQVDANMFMSNSFGTEFLAETEKEGYVYFLLPDAEADAIESIRFTTDAPFSEETFEPVDGAEDIDEEIEVTD